MSLTVPDIGCQMGRFDHNRVRRTKNARPAVCCLPLRHSAAHAVWLAVPPLDDPNGFT